MIKNLTSRKSGRFSLLVVFTLLISIGVQAQTEDDLPGSAPEESRPSLELKLSTITPVQCIDSPLVLELEITNISQEEVLIDKSALWRNFSYSFDATDGSGKGGAIGISHCGEGGEKITLSPGMTYWTTHVFPLAFDFFQLAGAYSLMTNFDSIHSNDVKFELYDCGTPQKIEDQQ